MTTRTARILISLYPRRWRERYEQEFLEFLQEHPPSISTVLNVIGGAFYQRLRALGDHRHGIFSIYTERARRAIFFARYEASQFGNESIEAGHLLLGVLRENGDISSRLFEAKVMQAISQDVKAQLTKREKHYLSVNLPLSPECKRILAYTKEEADRLNQSVGVEYLLLGILRDDDSNASEILRKHGLQLSSMREKLGQQ